MENQKETIKQALSPVFILTGGPGENNGRKELFTCMPYE